MNSEQNEERGIEGEPAEPNPNLDPDPEGDPDLDAGGSVRPGATPPDSQSATASPPTPPDARSPGRGTIITSLIVVIAAIAFVFIAYAIGLFG